MMENERNRASRIPVLVENVLLKQIRDIYEDVNTTSNEKKLKRESATEQFVEKCSEELVLPQDKVREIVDIVIAKAKWIEEIEELDEELEDEK